MKYSVQTYLPSVFTRRVDEVFQHHTNLEKSQILIINYK